MSEANWKRECREHAILACLGGGRKRMDVDDVEALSEIADESDSSLACMLLRGATINGRKL